MSCKTKILLFASVQMLVMLLYLSSTTLFVHSHTVDGQQLVHSHLYAGAASGHTHSQSHASLVSRIASSEMCFVESALTDIEVMQISVSGIVADITPAEVVALQHFALRAPPVAA